MQSCSQFDALRLVAGPARSRQRGVALPLVAAGLVAMLAVAGLALDVSHALTNKSRLQNTVDAAALAAAKEYAQTEVVTTSNTAAMAVFGANAQAAGNHELGSAQTAGEISVVIQWSETLNPFVSTGVGPYVRVIATNFDIQTSLSAVLGIADIGVAASAVAGPSPSTGMACNIAPLVACALDPEDPNLFGFSTSEIQVLKSASGGSSEVGPGNFQLIRLDCPGGDCVRENIAGSWDGCISNDETVETEPGNTVGPTAQGLNTRFGMYSGSMSQDDYPPDVVTTEPYPLLQYNDTTGAVTQDGAVVTDATVNYGWEQYKFDVRNHLLTYPPPVGVYERRVLALPIARCDGESSGQSTLDVVGFGCYFVMQRVIQKGTEAQIYGQFIEGCTASGMPGPAPVSGPDPYRIQLYKDPDSGDS